MNRSGLATVTMKNFMNKSMNKTRSVFSQTPDPDAHAFICNFNLKAGPKTSQPEKKTKKKQTKQKNDKKTFVMNKKKTEQKKKTNRTESKKKKTKQSELSESIVFTR